MAFFRRNNNDVADPDPTPEPEPTADPGPTGPAKKDRPTPTRKEAEAARRQRVTRQLTKKEARQEQTKANREQRLKTMQTRDATPEKQLMRDHVDSRFNLGEFLLPSLIVILALTFLSTTIPAITMISTVLMYVFILLVVFDGFLMWRSFKRLLAERLPKSGTKGLLFYGMNRAIQIRRFRIPPPRIKRRETF